MVCRVSNVLRAHDIRKGDRVAIYMPNSPMAVACMLACLRIGAMHSVVFAGFSSEALAARIQDGMQSSIMSRHLFTLPAIFYYSLLLPELQNIQSII